MFRKIFKISKMDQNKTIYNFTQDSDGTWTMAGVWVIDDFPHEECRAQSQKLQINNDTYMYLRFLNYLNRVGTRVSVIVFFNSLTQECPMDLTVRLLNIDPSKNQEKTTHAIYSSTALRSYIDFNVRWSELTEGSGYIDLKTGRLRIEFLFRHTLRPYEMPLQSLTAPPAIAPAPRPLPIDDAKAKYGVVGINTTGGDECLNAILLMLYSIPYFRNLVYKINTFGYEGTQNRALPLQKLFAALQTSKKAVSSEEFVKISRWQNEHVIMTHVSEAFTTILSAIRDHIDRSKFNELFQIGMKKVIRCPDINYESVKNQDVEVLEIKINQKKPQTLIQYLTSFSSNPEKIEEYIVNGQGAHTAFLSNEIASFPYIVFVILERFNIDETGTICQKLVDDLKIPLSINFNMIIPENIPTKPETWDLQSVLVHSGSAENGRFHANIRQGHDSDRWLEFRSYEVSEIPNNVAINSTDSVALLYTIRSKIPLLFNPCDAVNIPLHVSHPPPTPNEPPYLITLVTIDNYKQATLRGEVGCGLVGSHQFPAQRGSIVGRFIDVIASHLKISNTERILLWQVSQEGQLVSPVDVNSLIETVINIQNPVLFLQIAPESGNYLLRENEAVVFLKFYWKHAPYPLQFICSDRVILNDPVSSLYSTIASSLKVQETVPLIPLIEKSDYSASLLDQSASFSNEGIKNGDCIIFECPIEIPDFRPHFDFGKQLPAIRQAPQFPQYFGQDISDDVLFVDLTIEPDENGNDIQVVPDSVELFYDIRYHLAIIGISVNGSTDPPQSYFRIPLSYPFDELEHRISYDLGMAPHMNFYEPTDDGKQSSTIIDRNIHNSLKYFLMKLPSLTKRPITIYVQEVINE
ncbi:hypothetical protein TRFO_24605 [Tritrichomonas foetus]|uniref:USP domain-containing protein n=1 Tax=Tritrichomonas foetus TaxID=1144522 RepID=A0A1J4KCU1_9EUKA|nr:hypothetical protein TRFO_24605 [Tritrichomonas foetus]|eukprot:OHT07269.1 hypothetical protein TRFO_24605 [Tritrichomonas foetus]